MVRYSQPETSRSMADHTRLDTYSRSVRAQKKPPLSATRRWPSATRSVLDVGAWDDLDDDTKAVFARYMMCTPRPLRASMRIWAPSRRCRDLGELENTIVIFMSDNGGTAEGATRHSQLFKQFHPCLRLPADGTVTLRDII